MHKFINLRPILGISAGFRNNLVIAGIGSLAVATLTPETALAAPAITLKGSFDGANGAGPRAALTSAGNGKFYGTTPVGSVYGFGTIFEFDPGADSAPAPGPLPLMGAGAAFGWSRRLRRRIQPVRPLFPIGR